MQARRADIQVSFEGVDISAEVKQNLLALVYTDTEEDETDDLQITIEDRDGKWTERWLNVAVDAAAEQTAAAEQSAVYKVSARKGLNVRKGPGTGYAKLGALPYGTQVNVSSIEKGWASITYKGSAAFASATYLEQMSSAAAAERTAETGLKIRAAIIRRNWNGDGKDEVCDCGGFTLDTVDYSGPPAVLRLKASSLSFASRIRQTEQCRSWENYTLSRIAGEMTGKAGMKLLFLSERDPKYEREEQYQESDIAFLKRLCHNGGLSLKCCDDELVIFDQREYEAKEPEITIEKKKEFQAAHTADRDYTSWQMSVGTADVQYQSCRVSYNDPATGRSIEGVAKIPEWKEDKDNQQLEIRAKVKSAGEAMALAEKRLRLHNKFSKTAEFTMPGNPALAAGVTVRLAGWGAWDGKYIIRQAVHTVDGEGYQTGVSLRRVLEGY